MSLLDSPAPPLRRLRADEAPWPGALLPALDPGDPPTVHVALDLVPDVLWRAAPDGHLLVPSDIFRTEGGHAAVVPHCPHRLVERAHTASAGEAVTIAVSLLRAAAEARALGLVPAEDAGAWWVDASGRPVLALTGAANWADEALDLLEVLAAGAPRQLAAALDDAAAVLAAPRWPRADAAAAEDALFDAAEPLALRSEGHSDDAAARQDLRPRRSDSLRGECGEARSGRRRDAAVRSGETWIARFTEAGWAARVADALRGTLRGPALLAEALRERRAARSRVESPRSTAAPRRSGDESPARRRRAPILVAAALGATILVAGLMWPEPSAEAGSAPTPSITPATGGVETAEAAQAEDAPDTDGENTADVATQADAGEPTPDATGGDTLTAAAGAALTALTACGEGQPCPGVLETDGALVPAGVASSPGIERTASLLDEYGGVAVFRIEAVGEPGIPAQILVIVSGAHDTWLVRDVYDVADQP